MAAKSYKGRRSPGLERADALSDHADAVMKRAAVTGNSEARRLAGLASSAAFNSRSAYEASHGMGGGSSKAFSLRKEGARWLAKGRTEVDQASALLASQSSGGGDA